MCNGLPISQPKRGADCRPTRRGALGRCRAPCTHASSILSKEYARGEVHENRAECLCSLLKPYVRVLRGISKRTLPGYISLLQCLDNVRHQHACAQAELLLQAA